MILGPTDIAAVALYPELLRLLSLREQRHWRLLPVLNEGEVVIVAGTRVWPGGWSDALAILDRSDAKAFRCDPAGGQVWEREGDLAEVLDSLTELPAPSTRHAPALVQGKAPRLWLPRRLPDL